MYFVNPFSCCKSRFSTVMSMSTTCDWGEPHINGTAMHTIYVCMYGGTTVTRNIRIAWLYGDSTKYSIVHSHVPGHSNLANCKFTLV